MLFDLLQEESIDRKKVWDMLMKLPTNKQMLERLQNFDKEDGEINWDTLLDSNPSAIYKLLYSLQIVDNLMEMNEVEGVGSVVNRIDLIG